MASDLLGSLLEEKLVSPSAALAFTREPGVSVEDALVRAGLIDEVSLLRYLAQRHGTRYVLSEKLQEAQVPPEVLELLPLKVALELGALPLRFERSRSALLLAMADPSRAHELDEVPRIARIDNLVAYVALPSAVGQALRRLHRVEKRAFEPTRRTQAHCPSCRAVVAMAQLQCDACGLGLDLDAASDVRHERSVVRSLISVSAPRPEALGAQVQATAPYAFTVSEQDVAQVVPGVDLFAGRLSELEAQVVAFVDGAATSAELAERSELSFVEVRLLLSGLVRRGILSVRALAPEPEPEPVTEPVTIPTPLPAPAPAPEAAEGGADANAEDRAAERLIQKAFALEREGDRDATLRKLEEAIGRARRPAPLLSRLALLILHQWNEAHHAVRLLEKAVELEPDNDVLRTNLMKVMARAAALTDPRGRPPPRRRGWFR